MREGNRLAIIHWKLSRLGIQFLHIYVLLCIVCNALVTPI